MDELPMIITSVKFIEFLTEGSGKGDVLLNGGAGPATGMPTTRDGFLSLLFSPQQIVGYTEDGTLGANVDDADGGAGLVGGVNAARITDRARRFFGDIGTVEGGFMFRIARGEDDLRMGRPKFISDELFGKVLLGNLWPARVLGETDPVAGPGAEGATAVLGARAVAAAGTNELTYEADAPRAAYRASIGPNVESVPLGGRNGGANRLALFQLGRNRFDTSFVRSAYFAAAIQRMMGYHLRRALTEERRVIRPTHSLVAPDMTEFAVGESLEAAREFTD